MKDTNNNTFVDVAGTADGASITANIAKGWQHLPSSQINDRSKRERESQRTQGERKRKRIKKRSKQVAIKLEPAMFELANTVAAKMGGTRTAAFEEGMRLLAGKLGVDIGDA